MSNISKRYVPAAASDPDSQKQLKAQLYLTCSDQILFIKRARGENAALLRRLTGDAREALGRVDIKCLCISLGKDRRHICVDLNSAVFGRW
jgi:hypothetical protein